MLHKIMTEIARGNCQFIIVEDVSKSGTPYKRLIVKFGEYELGRSNNFIFLNDEKIFCIKSSLNPQK